MDYPPELSMQWYCVAVQTRQERVAAAHLALLDEVETFCPRIRFKTASRRGLVTWVTEALFPGYLFVRFRFALSQRLIKYAHGVREIVQFGEQLTAIPDRVISELREHFATNEVKE